MKVLMLNGSPRGEGCTCTALKEIEGVLKAQGVETEIVNIGKNPVTGCIGCAACKKTGKCVFGDKDGVNEFAEKAREADGFIFGAPVHYASAGAAACAFLDRAFYSAAAAFKGKPGAAVVSCRRAGSTAALDRLNKYFTINQMPIVSSTYWNMVHGNTPEEVRQDLEGMQVMRCLGHNMAWLLKCIEAGKKAGIVSTFDEKRVSTNFIR